MHERPKMTPARVIINAAALGSLAWLVILFLRLLAELAEPFLVALLQQQLQQVLPGYLFQPWHVSSDGWYGEALEAIHHAFVIGVVAVSALRDIWKIVKGG